MKMIFISAVLATAMVARADYWMTFCKTPGGQQYSQVGYVKPDSDGFVTIKAGPMTVVVYKTQVWYLKMPGEALAEGKSRFGKGIFGEYPNEYSRCSNTHVISQKKKERKQWQMNWTN